MAARPKYYWEPQGSTGHVYEGFGGLPAPAAFTKASGSASATVTSNGGSDFVASADAATGLNFFEIPNPAADPGNFRLYARIRGITRGANYWGIHVRNVAAGRAYMSARQDNNLTAYIQSTAFALTFTAGNVNNPDYPGWMMIELVGGLAGTINFYESADGFNWLKCFSEATAAYLNALPDKIGIFVNQGTTLLQAGAWVSSFGITAPQ